MNDRGTPVSVDERPSSEPAAKSRKRKSQAEQARYLLQTIYQHVIDPWNKALAEALAGRAGIQKRTLDLLASAEALEPQTLRSFLTKHGQGSGEDFKAALSRCGVSGDESDRNIEAAAGTAERQIKLAGDVDTQRAIERLKSAQTHRLTVVAAAGTKPVKGLSKVLTEEVGWWAVGGAILMWWKIGLLSLFPVAIPFLWNSYKRKHNLGIWANLCHAAAEEIAWARQVSECTKRDANLQLQTDREERAEALLKLHQALTLKAGLLREKLDVLGLQPKQAPPSTGGENEPNVEGLWLGQFEVRSLTSDGRVKPTKPGRSNALASDIEVDGIYEGKVSKLMDFGAFVTIAPGMEGLVHISQLAERRIEKASDAVKEGQLVRVKVLEISNDGKVRLSMKEAVERASIEKSDVLTPLQEEGFSFAIPAIVPFIGGESLLFEVGYEGLRHKTIGTIQQLIFQLLRNLPPGKVQFTFLDPLGQGQNVSAFLPLADFHESLVTTRAWTSPQHIGQRLSELTEHMETVIQKYLRNDFPTIEDYNRHAGEIAEAYRVIVVFDFPDSFNDESVRQLVRIIHNGERCGVYALVLCDTSKQLPHGFELKQLESSATVFAAERAGRMVWRDPDFGRDDGTLSLRLGAPPESGDVAAVVRAVGERAKEALKVEVPYKRVLQMAGIDGGQLWGQSTIRGLRVPLGPTGARKVQFLDFGSGTAVHALVVGRPGSGKSNLMHVVITIAAQLYPPDELELYLIDFKKGVEFKGYADAKLPHARVIAVESEREFGLSVLRGLDDVLKKRGEMFRKTAAENIQKYREATGEKLPRILLLVDEFQEFFVQDDSISSESGLLFDRLVRQGRAFGIHLVLGSQTLAGYTLPRATLNLIPIRIALQSSEADSRMILADDNPAARLLTRPGEGVYNAASGLIEGNSLFQVALFTEDDRKQALASIHAESSRQGGSRTPLVFEGHEAAVLADNTYLRALRQAASWAPTAVPEAWFGEPVAIRPATGMKLRRQSGAHLLVVTKNEEEAVGVILAAVVSLALQMKPSALRFAIIDLTTAEASWANAPEDLAESLPHKVEVLGRRDVKSVIGEFHQELAARLQSEQGASATWVLVILGLHRARDLRQDDSPSRFSFDEATPGPKVGEQLMALLKDGPEVGLHIMAWCDAYSNLDRVLERRSLTEFGTRVLGSMSNSDSISLIDDAAASKIDRPHRMVKYDEEHVGTLETFRPYGLPGKDWVVELGAGLKGRSD